MRINRPSVPATRCEHKWAHNEDPNKRGRLGQMSFHGLTMYSYSTVIAVKYPKQKVCVIAGDGIQNSSYTCRHKMRAMGALDIGWVPIFVDIPNNSPYYSTPAHELESLKGLGKCYKYMVDRAKRAAKLVPKGKSAPSRNKRWREYCALLQRARDLGTFLKRAPLTNKRMGFTDEYVTEMTVARLAAEAISNERCAARDAKRRADWALWEVEHNKPFDPENIVLWRNHKYTGDIHRCPTTLLRLTKDGTSVQTSKGVTVPIDDARKLFSMCRVLRRASPILADDAAFASAVEVASAQVDGVGGYDVHNITRSGDCTVGCHQLTFDEMELCFNTATAKGLVADDVDMPNEEGTK